MIFFPIESTAKNFYNTANQLKKNPYPNFVDLDLDNLSFNLIMVLFQLNLLQNIFTTQINTTQIS